MAPSQFQDDLAQWDLCTGKGLVSDLDAWRDRYITEKVAQGVSDKTRKSYGEALTPLIEFAHQYDSIMDLEGISAKFVNNYLMWYQEQLSAKDLEANKISMDEYNQVLSNRKANRGKNDAKLSIVYRYEKSISHRLTVLKQLLLFISENNKENKDFTLLFKYFTKIKVQKRKTEFVTEGELEELIDFMKHWPEVYKEYFPKSSERYAYRNALIVLLYCLTGARADEVISLRLEHIKESEYKDDNGTTHLFYTIAYHTTKGDKYREVVVRREEIEPFVSYLRTALSDPSYVISSTYANGSYTNKKMADVDMWKFTTYALKAIGVNKSGRHIIRRGYATKELADGKDLAIVAMELGHTSTNTTFSAYVKNNPELMMRQKVKGFKTSVTE
ncbi:MAG: site-specific integrase [Sulfuricurvum sp.]|jgi:integrase/recombinase XerD